jgi:hypothetical protein
MRLPRWITEDRVLAFVQIALALGGGALVTAGVHSLTSLPWLYLAGVFLLVAGGVAGLLYRFMPSNRALHRATPIPDEPSASAPREGWVRPEELGSYLDSINRTMEERGFGRQPNVPPAQEPTGATPSWEELNAARVKRYEETRGLFLIHTWQPSNADGQVADVTLRLCQHAEGPLARGEIKAVEYTLGPKFSNHSLVCTDARNDFALTVAMWGPMLCLAKVYFADGRQPLLLERYINFDQSVVP